MDAALLARPALELARALRARELSAVALVQAHIDRAAAVNVAINALAAERFGAALSEAHAAERELATSSHTEKPLLGVPFTVKEMIEVEGMPYTFGNLRRRDCRGVADATVVARLRAAGAIPIAVTNVSEWGMWPETYNPVYGRTNNPWDVRRTPGGSSGGEGALVAAGGSAFGIGSDIGGSVRIPAAFCGVFGHKPTHGLLPLTGHYPVTAHVPEALTGAAHGQEAALTGAAPLLSIGTLTRSAADIEPLLRIMAGDDGVDPNIRELRLRAVSDVAWGGRRVLLLAAPSIQYAGAAARELRSAVEAAGRLLEQEGAVVEEAPADLFRRAGTVWSTALQHAGGASFAELLGGGERLRLLPELLATAAGRGGYSGPALLLALAERFGRRSVAGVARGLAELDALEHRFQQQLGDGGVLIMPVHPRPAPRHNALVLRPFDFLYTAVFNALRVPATSVPVGLGADGLPLAVQVVGACGHDHVTIAAAAVIGRPVLPAPVRSAEPAAASVHAAATASAHVTATATGHGA